jgi:assimilatory nitrate reductase catalytic subunit
VFLRGFVFNLISRSGPLSRLLQLSKGAHGRLPDRLQPQETKSLVCGYCSTGCSLTVHLREGKPVNLLPQKDYPVNRGSACPKGWEALAPLGAPDRATRPLYRENGKLQPIEWDRALDVFVTRMKSLQAKHGAQSTAFLSTGQMVTEEMALLGALAKFGMGMIHGDGNTRQCMATSVVAYKESFGFDAPPYSYDDLEESDVVILAGSNLCIAHPILWERLVRNRRRPAIVVVDPRKTETAMAAGFHYAIAPKSDLILWNGIARILIERGAYDRDFVRDHVNGFEELRAHVEKFPLERVAQATGLQKERIDELAAVIERGQRVSFWWTMGVNQGHEAVRTAQSIINLALLTGNIGRPGTGANSITGQCNAMGSRLFSNTTNLFGGRSFTNPDDRAQVAGILDIPVEKIPDKPSLAYDQILERILTREIRGLWIVATNPAHSWINQRDVHEVLSRLEFLVVQDMYASNETAAFAHLVLPAAGWGEKDGTFINSERRIGLVRKLARPPGEALSDFQIFQRIAEAWGCGPLLRRWRSPEDVFRILGALSKGQPCDFSHLQGYAELNEGVQWGGARLFEDRRFFYADQKARFVVADPRPLPEAVDARYPFLLNSGRGSSSQWHTQTRTRSSKVLERLHPRELYVEINPLDARKLSISPHEKVLLVSRRAEIVARAFLTHSVAPGQLFVPMHYREANQLTFPAFDPHSRQPAYKSCAVALRKIA